MNAELMKLRQLQKLYEAFMGGPLHNNYQGGCREKIAELEGQILTLDPVTREDEIEMFKLRGELRRMLWMIDLFRHILDDLEKEIDDLENEEVGAQPPKRDRYEDPLTSN